MSKVAFHTLGCKLNFSETSTIGEQFLKRGYSVVDYNEKADVYVINTCTVTDNADKECRQIVRRALKNNPEAYIIVTGCYAQLRPDEIVKIDGVDAVLGSNEKFKLFEYINKFEKQKLSCIHVSPTEKLDEFNSSFSTDGNDRTRAFFKVQDGCDYKCSFCTIPLARGKSRSAKPDEVIKEFNQLLAADFKEIILTGVNVGDYTSTLNGINVEQEHEQDQEVDLYALLRKMLTVQGNYRIRISSIEPNLLNDEILDLAASDSRMCNHFHIPLQSGSTKILKLMQRRYKTDDYKNLIYKAVEKIPNLAIGVDVIIGFPGETEEDFLETYAFLRDLPISYLHVFTYSERPNTKAIEMPGEVDHIERKKRSSMLRILSEKKKHEFYQSMIGKELIALFEHEDHNGVMKGFTSNYVRIKAPFNSELINKFVHVKIAEVDENICTAEILLQTESKKNSLD
ncbi:MAG: tRNA (N(6)-L-threonylcarbamoyladenosine(37)-C(2))-methylthiotransferase MtaB [Stygiobacter sp. RIFOXYC12_FULL_38_8]|nr:MAG: tRNA (N(6)-L-threonylcarbamoyladenosine(37)-C(2))-methylthiotransferase MtaB [Stygiobacter sp. GWC2_38_9]OGV06773.1 MAG: tRNA (N(6)-L-threonylcarbamoyladenosine(37)-C(2))-methylthiotransferase MtaB [Stygiobacter sp. RIFOXYB2_FULL_37_11]OGV13405.1 MAG: tRNA (N(6)-L-threonylcarbamoyladenosine(37)-C(2))-methylthiotransferase MtaB [Stygiobacter sp. RIFOXYC2_FULL_38_25]OGV17930.1 MAG: tRNA (N(6)-L-threonylcarbamoyladenosine(37)-C(2))-methylthiotransferase MtaB [Stygiobacter sp. RIFOXYA2_FULL_